MGPERGNLTYYIGLLFFLGCLSGCWAGAYFAILELEDDDDSFSGSIPGPFTLIGPTDNKLDVLALTPTFTWSDATGERNYDIEVSSTANFSVILHTSPLLPENTLTYTLPVALPTSGGTYYWRVRAINEGGVRDSAVFQFIALDTPWSLTFGAGGNDRAYSLALTSDGGFIVAGSTFGVYGDGSENGIIIKCNSDGTPAWQKVFGGGGIDRLNSVIQTSDGGYIAAGSSSSYGSSPGTNLEFWVIKLDGNGNPEWQNVYSGAGDDEALQIRENTADASYIVAGEYNTGSPNQGRVLELNLDGTMATSRLYNVSGGGNETMDAVTVTADNGYLFCGRTYLDNTFREEIWLIKTDANLTVQWEQIYGARRFNAGYWVEQTSDGGYIVLGAGLFNPDATTVAGHLDYWIQKVDSNGAKDWQITYGQSFPNHSRGRSIQQTSDNGYILAGTTEGFGDLHDAWLIKLQPGTQGAAFDWQKRYGGAGEDYCRAARILPDGSYLAAGYTDSFGAGGEDIWVFKVGPNGELPTIETVTATPGTVSFEYNLGVTLSTNNPTLTQSTAGINDTDLNPTIWAPP